MRAGERVQRIEQAIREAVPDGSLAAIVPALMPCAVSTSSRP